MVCYSAVISSTQHISTEVLIFRNNLKITLPAWLGRNPNQIMQEDTWVARSLCYLLLQLCTISIIPSATTLSFSRNIPKYSQTSASIWVRSLHLPQCQYFHYKISKASNETTSRRGYWSRTRNGNGRRIIISRLQCVSLLQLFVLVLLYNSSPNSYNKQLQ